MKRPIVPRSRLTSTPKSMLPEPLPHDEEHRLQSIEGHESTSVGGQEGIAGVSLLGRWDSIA